MAEARAGGAWTRLAPAFVNVLCGGLATAYAVAWAHFTFAGAAGNVADFLAFYVGGWMLRSGAGARLYDLAAQGAFQREVIPTLPDGAVLPYVNPPPLAALVAPLSLLTYPMASLVWTAVNVLLYALAGWLCARQIGTRPGARRTLLLGAFAFGPFFASMVLGQSAVLVLAVQAVFVALLDRGHERGAGLVLALGLVKPQLLPVWLVVLAWQRRWSALGAFAAGAAAFGAASLALVGPAALTDYARLVAGLGEYAPGYAPALNNSWHGFWRIVLPQNDELAVTAEVLSCAATVGLVLRAWRGPWRPGLALAPCRVASAFVAAPLLAPHVLVHDLVLWVPAGMALASVAGGTRGQRRWAAWALLGIGFAVGLLAVSAQRESAVLTVPLMAGALAWLAADTPGGR